MIKFRKGFVVRKELFIGTLITLLLCTTLLAQGGLALIDHSVVFEGNSRKEVTRFINRSTDTLNYNISLISCRMDSAGEIEPNIDSSNEYEASPYLRIFPRSVSVPPGVLQSVAIQLRPSDDMEAGEYRSHLLFEPSTEKLKSEPEFALGLLEVTTNVKLISAISIPVSILVDDLIASGSISDMDIVDANDSSSLVIDVKRLGNRSLRGVFDFEHIPESGEAIEFQSKSVTIYRELDNCRFSYDISEIPRSGTLRVSLKLSDSEGNDIILDTNEISL